LIHFYKRHFDKGALAFEIYQQLNTFLQFHLHLG
jgi:hypothetical protein